MSDKDQSIISKEIYDFFIDFYQHEQSIKYNNQENKGNKGYLIDLQL